MKLFIIRLKIFEKVRDIAIFFIVNIVFLFSSINLIAEVKIVPYYDLQIGNGTVIPNKGEWIFSLNLINDLGLILQPLENHRFIGFYELRYSGPGLRRQEGEKFTDRLINHIFVIRHHYNILQDYTLKSQVDYTIEYKRTGTNEVLGEGLYDYIRYGIAETLEKKFNDNFITDVSLKYYFLNFPNYTDLLEEFRSAGEDYESSTGKQNHSLYQLGLSCRYYTAVCSINYMLMAYQKQKVITETVQEDGTYYSDTLQRDTIFSVSGQYGKTFLKRVYIEPLATIKFKRSNQNYQHFKDFTVTNTSSPVAYQENYYDYNQIILSLPITIGISNKWQTSLTPEFDWKFYTDRPPRDNDNNFIDGKMNINLFILSLCFTYSPNEITKTSFIYTYQSQTSNMKFEKYLPYNYDGHFFGINFNYRY